MTQKLRCTFEMEIDVEFTNPAAAKSYFVDGPWKETFYDLPELEGVAECLAAGFHHETDRYKGSTVYRFVEGFGRFVRQEDRETYKSSEELANDIGGSYILVRYESELDSAGTFTI